MRVLADLPSVSNRTQKHGNEKPTDTRTDTISGLEKTGLEKPGFSIPFDVWTTGRERLCGQWRNDLPGITSLPGHALQPCRLSRLSSPDIPERSSAPCPFADSINHSSSISSVRDQLTNHLLKLTCLTGLSIILAAGRTPVRSKTRTLYQTN